MAGERVGSHCSYPWCRQFDFLPFKCFSCGLNFCLNHRDQRAHECLGAPMGAAQGAHQAGSAGTTGYGGPSDATGGGTSAGVPGPPPCGMEDGGPPFGEGPLDVSLKRHQAPVECDAAAAAAARPKCSFPYCCYKAASVSCLICCSCCSKCFCPSHRHPEHHGCSAAAAAAAAAKQQQQRETIRQQVAAALGPAAAARIVSDAPRTSSSSSSSSSKKLSGKAQETQKRLELLRVKMLAKGDPTIPAAAQLPLRIDLSLLSPVVAAAAAAAQQQQQQYRKDRGVCLMIDARKTLGCALDRILETFKITNKMATKGGPQWGLVLPQQQQTAAAITAAATTATAAGGVVLDLSQKASELLVPGDTVMLSPNCSSNSNSSSMQV